MLFNVALFTCLLLAPGALAVPSGLAAQLAHHSRGCSRSCESGGDTNTTVQYNPDLAGAILTQDKGTFHFVSGIFTVPTLSYPTNSSEASAFAWVGIDGQICSSVLRSGVDLVVDNGLAHYNAWYQWSPDSESGFSQGISISAGDVIRLTVVATTTTTGVASIDNLSNGQTASENLTSTSPLCQQNAEWIISRGGDINNLTNFGNVTFTSATAGGAAFYTPADAQTILEIKQNSVVLTSVSTCESSVTITYL